MHGTFLQVEKRLSASLIDCSVNLNKIKMQPLQVAPKNFIITRGCADARLDATSSVSMQAKEKSQLQPSYRRVFTKPSSLGPVYDL